MPTNVVHLTCQFESVSGLPEDRYMNTFTAQSDSLSPGGIVAQFGSNLEDFYNATRVHASVGSYLSTAIDRTVPVLVLGYDITAHLDGSTAGPPIDAGFTFTLDDPTVDRIDLPNECAVVLSFHGVGSFPEGPPEGPRPAERHRGRIYLGPLNDSCKTPLAGSFRGDVLLNTNAGDDFQAAAIALASNTGNADWSVWSRANAAVYTVFGGFIDDAFDTQRRRGSKATGRYNWLAP